MIEFEHVSKTYETHNDENVALEDINIHIEEGEFVLCRSEAPTSNCEEYFYAWFSIVYYGIYHRNYYICV